MFEQHFAGLLVHDTFSGYFTAGIVLQQLHEEMERAADSKHLPPPRCTHVCERTKALQQLLAKWDGPLRPCCVFSEYEARLPASVRKAADMLLEKRGHMLSIFATLTHPSRTKFPTLGRPKSDLGLPSPRFPAYSSAGPLTLLDAVGHRRGARGAAEQTLKDSYVSMGTLYRQFFAGEEASTCDMKADCCLHGFEDQCYVYQHLQDGRASSNAASIAFAGHVCVDWSAIGARKQEAGSSMRHLMLFFEEVRFLKPDFVICECAAEFNAELYRVHLPEYQVLEMCLDANEDLGDKVKGCGGQWQGGVLAGASPLREARAFV